MKTADPRQIIFDFDALPPPTLIHGDFGGKFRADIEVAPLTRGWCTGYSCELGPENAIWVPRGSHVTRYFPDHQSALRYAVYGIDRWIEMARANSKDPKRQQKRYPGLEKAAIWIAALATRRGIDLVEGRRLSEERLARMTAEAIRERAEYMSRRAA